MHKGVQSSIFSERPVRYAVICNCFVYDFEARPRFACFLYDFVPNLAVVKCVWYDFVLRCRFPVRFRTNRRCFHRFRLYFVKTVVRFRTNFAVCFVSGTIDAPVPWQICSIRFSTAPIP